MAGQLGAMPSLGLANRRSIQSAGYRQSYKKIHEEPIAEEEPGKQRVNTQQFRSTMLESAKGPRKLILSKSK